MLLELATPTRQLVSEEVDEVVAPGSEGYFGVLPGHAAFLATLGSGEVVYRRGRDEVHLAVHGGFAEVTPERVIILAETAERPDEIDRAIRTAPRARSTTTTRSRPTSGPSRVCWSCPSEAASAPASPIGRRSTRAAQPAGHFRGGLIPSG